MLSCKVIVAEIVIKTQRENAITCKCGRGQQPLSLPSSKTKDRQEISTAETYFLTFYVTFQEKFY